MKKKNKVLHESMTDAKPYERCLACGPQSLTDAELLAVILRTGIQGIPVTQLAAGILEHTGCGSGLLGLLHTSVGELMTIPGIGQVKAIQLICIGELSRRISRMKAEEGLLCSVPSSVADFYMEELRHKEQECLILLMLDGSGHRIGDICLTQGTVNASLISPREIYIEAMKHRAVNIIILHNHPSGDPTPSREDYEVTEKVRKAGELLDIPLLDHIIIGDRNYRSFCEDGFFER